MSTTITTPATIAAAVAYGNTPAMVALKAQRDALYHGGTKAQRPVLIAANGVQAAYKARGYTRTTFAHALGLGWGAAWLLEFVLPAGNVHTKAVVKHIATMANVAKAAPTKANVAKAKAAPVLATPAPASA